jgi:hypothetical protein
MSDIPGEIPAGYYGVRIPAEFTSRGTGELVPLSEASEFDYMPQLIGSRFQEQPGLQAKIHADFVVSGSAPFLTAMSAYQEYAELLLMRGNLEGAVDAYKTSLYNATSFRHFLAPLGQAAVLSSEEAEKLDLGSQYGDLEQRMMDQIWQGDMAFHPEDYADFVAIVREQRKKRGELGNRLFRRSGDGERDYDPEIGRQYIDLCIEMGDFSMAGYVAKALGFTDEHARLASMDALQVKTKNDPELKSIIADRMPRSQWD